MDEISNKTLAILLLGAIVISLGGTLISLNKLGKIREQGVTGFAGTNTSRGNISLTIQDVTWINFSVKKCMWGTGYAYKPAGCWLNTTPDAANFMNATACLGFTQGGCNGPLVLKNIGNNNVSLNLSFSNTSAFLTGINTLLQFKLHNSSGTGAVDWSSGGCTRGGANGGNMTKFNNIWRNVTAARSNVTCDRFYFGNGRNTINMYIKIMFGQSAISGTKQLLITAVGKTKAG
jgi:hypothetical protein